MTRSQPVLSVRGLHKSFGPVRALDGVDLEVHRHEVVALVGDNAAGKSTLAKVIAGVLTPDAGTVVVDGKAVPPGSPATARSLGVATVFQDLALAENLDVVQNLFLGQELAGKGGLGLDEATMENRAREILASLTSRIPSVRTPLSALSAGQRQTVAIARTQLGDPKVVVLDEPTASLSVAQTAEVLTHVQSLRDLGHGVILISHNLSDVLAVADRVEVLRHGHNNGSFTAAEVTHEAVVAAITGATRLRR
ncbi:ATP-binding cassette domain-containing protein [Myceligenerans crystallogenes]|uniref:ATP-binding cassette domain-containing protein n=1 Tax=Myceligenerans crystallogenes TaxID=316335 RepID=A0ABN2N4G3_9MICO